MGDKDLDDKIGDDVEVKVKVKVVTLEGKEDNMDNFMRPADVSQRQRITSASGGS